MDQGIDAVVSAGDGPGNDYAKFRNHVLPLVGILIGLAALLIWGLIALWPQCDSCVDSQAASAVPAAAPPAPAGANTEQGMGAANQGAASHGAANQGAANQGTATQGAVNQGKANQDAATGGAANQVAVNQGAVTQGAGVSATGPGGARTAVQTSEALAVHAVSPTTACTTGGIPVTITGRWPGKANPQVAFGGAAASSAVGASGSLVAIAPPHAAGTVDVVVKAGSETVTLTNVFTYACAPSQRQLLLLVLLAGMLGGLLHSLRSLFWFAGNRNLRVSWLLMYYLLPLSGGIIAAIFFLVFVASLYTPSSGKGPFLIVGIGALVGMFSQQAVEKLKKIGEAVLTTVPKQADQTPVPAPGLAGIDPANGPATGDTPIKLTGSGFVTGATVMFDTSAATQVQVVDSTTINAVAPSHDAGKVDVTVRNPDGSKAKLVGGFEYKAPPAAPPVVPPAAPPVVPPAPPVVPPAPPVVPPYMPPVVPPAAPPSARKPG
jgi:IPT/TIG domain